MARFESAGVKLIAIGIGEPKKARIFAEKVFINLFPFANLFVLFKLLIFQLLFNGYSYHFHWIASMQILNARSSTL